MAFVKTNYTNETDDWPDIQLFLATTAENTDGGVLSKRITGITDDFFADVFENIVYNDSFAVFPLLMRPRSTGEILLRSTDPKDAPLIFPNYYGDPYDMKVMVSPFIYLNNL